jgi:adenosine deaminase
MEASGDIELLKKVCYEIPKAELHIHIEGSMEPELIFQIANRNKIDLPYKSIEELEEKYNFNNLQEFLDLYYVACSVLLYKQDFEDIMYMYLKSSYHQGLKYCEIFFDPQSHLQRGVEFETIISGLKSGINLAKNEFDIEAHLIMSFLRHLSEEDSIKTFEIAKPYFSDIIGIGLDSSEIGNPPEKFHNLFKLAKTFNLKLVAHAGEEGDVSYIKNSIELLGVQRIDHGYRIIDDESYMKKCVEMKIPFTLCPLSNKKLNVCPDLKKYPLKHLLKNGLKVVINSDDPAYFGGYIGDNYLSMVTESGLDLEEIILLAKYSFQSTFLDDDKIEKYINLIDKYVEQLDINK